MKRTLKIVLWSAVGVWFAITIPFSCYCFVTNDSPPLAKVLVGFIVLTAILVGGYLDPKH